MTGWLDWLTYGLINWLINYNKIKHNARTDRWIAWSMRARWKIMHGLMDGWLDGLMDWWVVRDGRKSFLNFWFCSASVFVQWFIYCCDAMSSKCMPQVNSEFFITDRLTESVESTLSRQRLVTKTGVCMPFYCTLTVFFSELCQCYCFPISQVCVKS